MTTFQIVFLTIWVLSGWLGLFLDNWIFFRYVSQKKETLRLGENKSILIFYILLYGMMGGFVFITSLYNLIKVRK